MKLFVHIGGSFEDKKEKKFCQREKWVDSACHV
jgi:hypothetical protein